MQPDYHGLIEQARRNEEILRRLDEVEEFLLAHHGLKDLLRHLGRRVAATYQLETASLVLCQDHQRLAEALAALEEGLPAGCLLRPRRELRLILGDLERCYLSNRLAPALTQCFFEGGPFVASAAVIPLWVRGELLGALSLGSASPKRYHPGLDSDFLARLGRKVAAGLDASLLLEQTKYLERREAAVEMAGATCHELAQPLTTAELLLERILRTVGEDHQAHGPLTQLRAELERLGHMVQDISQVSDYVTRPYARGLRIVDIEAAGPGQDARPPNGEER